MAGRREAHPSGAEEEGGGVWGVEGVDMGRERVCGWSEFNLVTSHTGAGKHRTDPPANDCCTITAPTALLP